MAPTLEAPTKNDAPQTKAALAIAELVAKRSSPTRATREAPSASSFVAEKSWNSKQASSGERYAGAARSPADPTLKGRGAARAKATHVLLNHFNQCTFEDYHKAVNRPRYEVAVDNKWQINSTRCTLFQLTALTWLLLVILRPYFLLASPTVVALLLANPRAKPFAERVLEGGSDAVWNLSSIALAWLLVFTWHCYAEFWPKRSPRTDGRKGAGPFGTVSPAGWHFDRRNIRMGRLREALGKAGDYSAVATPWLFSGDLRTLIPFALNRPKGKCQGNPSNTWKRGVTFLVSFLS